MEDPAGQESAPYDDVVIVPVRSHAL